MLGRCTVGKVAAFLGMMQGLGWAVLSLTCIVLYHKSHTMDTLDTYNMYLQYLLFHQYISEPIFHKQAVIRPIDFNIFMWVYYFLSIGWLAASSDLFVSIHYNRRRQTLLMYIWAAVTTAISITDLVFTVLLARDYSECNDDSVTEYACYLVTGIMMTLASRGYTLWAINIIFAFIMVSKAHQMTRKDTFVDNDKYRIPRAKVPSTHSTMARNAYNPPGKSEQWENPAFMKTNSVYY